MIFCYERFDKRIYISTNRTINDRVSQVMGTYFTINEIEKAEPDSWLISLSNDFLLCLDKSMNCFVLKQDREPDITVYLNGNKKIIGLLEENDIDWQVQNLIRMVRALSRLTSFNDDWIFLHGGAIEVDGKGICVLGRKKSGKTSSIISLMKTHKADFISNDDVSIGLRGNAWYAEGWPRSIVVRKDTFDMLDVRQTIMLTHPLNSKINLGKEICFYPSQLTDLFSCRQQRNCKINFFVFPRFSNLNQISISVMNKDEALKSIMENVLLNPGKFNEFLLPYFKSQDGYSINAKINELLKDIVCIRLNQPFNMLEEASNMLIDFIKKV